MKRIFITSILVLGVLILTSGYTRAEKLMVYSALHEYEIARLLDAFREDTGIGTDFIRMSAGECVARIKAEKAAPKADVFLGGPCESHEVLAKDGLLLQYVPPVASEIEKRFHSPEGYWHGFYLGALAICLNKERFDKELKPKGIAYPKTWEDLLNPAFKGEIVVASPWTSGTAYTFVCTHLQRLGREAGWMYLEELGKNVHHYTKAGAAPARMAATGEFLIGITFGHDIFKPMAADFPLVLVYPPDTGWEIGGLSIIKGGPNSELAKKFVNWMLGRKAGQLHTDISLRISTRADVAMPPKAIPLKDIKLLAYDYMWAAANRDDILKEWDKRVKK